MVRGVSAGFTPPSGAGTFIYGFRTLVSTTGVGGKFCNIANFKPIAGTKKGGSMTFALKKLTSGITMAPFFGLFKGTDPTVAEGYYVALTQESSFKIGLFKGTAMSGMSATAAHKLRTSTATYSLNGDGLAAWFHIRLDILVNPHGEVVIDVYQNDLAAHLVTAPAWAAIAGLTQFIDDPLGYHSGGTSTPHLDGFYPVYGMYTNSGVGEAVLFDHGTVHRQIAP